MGENHAPPSWPLGLLKRICDPNRLEVLYGDVEEMYRIRKSRSGRFIADIFFLRDALSLVRPFTLKQAHEISPTLNFFQMIRIYLKSGFRALRKNPMASGINIFGLTLGMLSVLLITQYVYFELSYDRFHPDYQNIFRVSYQKEVNNEQVYNASTTLLPVGSAIQENNPEVNGQVRLYYPFTHAVINIDDQSYGEEKPVFAEESFFTLFGFELLEGNPETVLSEPNSIVLSEQLANTYFGYENAIGSFLNFSFEDGEAVFKVTGIVENPRQDSHIKSHMYISLNTLEQWPIFKQSEWQLPFYHTYIKTVNNPNIGNIERFAGQLISDNSASAEGKNVSHMATLQPVKDIHLDSNLTFELEANGNRNSVYFLLLVAFITLSIAYLNYVNMATALASKRAKEVGVRKVLGSKRKQLVDQFLIESLILNLIAFFVAALISFPLLKELNKWLDTQMPLFRGTEFWLAGLVIVGLGSLVSGIYPAFVLSGFSTKKVLKGDFLKGNDRGVFRSILVSSQFVISVIMIGTTLLVVRQTDFLMTKDLGFESNQMLILKAPRTSDSPEVYAQKIRRLANDLKSTPEVLGFATSGSIPGKVMGSGSFTNPNDVEGESIEMQLNSVNEGYFDTYDLEFLTGRSFSSESPTDQGSLIINEAAMRVLKFGSLNDVETGKITAFGRDWPILGVIKDYHHTSLKTDYEPIVFLYSPDICVYFSVNLNTNNLSETLNDVESALVNNFPNNPFDYFFLDDSFQQQFKADLRFADLFKSFAVLAVLLAALGLFGLAAFIASQKAKELSIRKVLGASNTNIFAVLMSYFQWPILIGVALAGLSLFFGANAWLNTFPFRVNIGWQIFVLPLITVLTIAVLIILYNTKRAVNENPVKRLRQE